MLFSVLDNTNPLDKHHRLSFGAMFLCVLGVAVAWISFYQLNNWLFSGTHISRFVSWIFLPAAIRMLAVIALGGAGGLGLFVGALVTNFIAHDVELTDSLVLAGLSASGPLCAVFLCTHFMRLPNDLLGLQRSHLFMFAAVGSLFNVVPHNIYFYLNGLSETVWTGMMPMFVGDLIGTLIVLYIASVSLRFISKRIRA